MSGASTRSGGPSCWCSSFLPGAFFLGCSPDVGISLAESSLLEAKAPAPAKKFRKNPRLELMGLSFRGRTAGPWKQFNQETSTCGDDADQFREKLDWLAERAIRTGDCQMRRGTGGLTEVLFGPEAAAGQDRARSRAESEAPAKGWATSIAAVTREGAKEKNASASMSICAALKQSAARLKLIPRFEMHAVQSAF